MNYLKQDLASKMDFRDMLRIFFKRWWVMPVVLIVSLVGGFLSTVFMTPMYQSEARLMFIGQPHLNSPFYDQLPVGREVSMASTQSNMAISRDVLREVVLGLKLQDRDETQYDSAIKKFVSGYVKEASEKAKGLKDKIALKLFNKKPKEDDDADPVTKTVENLMDRVKAEEVEKSDVIRVTAEDFDSETAAKIGNVVARTYILFSLRQQLDDVHTRYGDNHPLGMQLNDEIRRVESRLLAPVRTVEPDFGSSNVKIIQHAAPSASPFKPRKLLVLGVSGFAGLLGGFFLILLLEQMDPTYRGVYDLKGHVNVPFLGAVPTVTWNSWKGIRRKKMEDYLNDGVFLPLAYQIQALRTKHNVRSICFSGADTTESNLKLVQLIALSLSKINRGNTHGKPGNILLVESSSFDRGSFFGSTVNAIDHRSMMEHPDDAKQLAVPVTKQLAVSSLGHLKNGSSTYAYEEEKCREFLKAMQDQYDLVVFRGPDFSQRAEFLFLNSLCDATILMVNQEQTRRKVVESMLETFALNDVKVLGTILNDQKFYLPSILYSLM